MSGKTILLVPVVFFLVIRILSTNSFASSPAFPVQEFTHPSNEWIPTHPTDFAAKPKGSNYAALYTHYLKDRQYVSNCSTFSLPEISGVSYVSDGKILNDTLWLYRPLPAALKVVSYPSHGKILNDTLWLYRPAPSNVSDYPSWNAINFQMEVHVKSFYDAGANYLVRLNWDNNNMKNMIWNKTVEQISPHRLGILPQEKFLEFTNLPKSAISNANYIDLAINLDSIGSPADYQVISNLEAVYTKGAQKCDLTDITPWVSLPPPQIYLSTIPSSISLTPGDEKAIEIRANSSANMDSLISLNATAKSGITLHFFPPIIYLPAHGIGSSTLRIIAPGDLIQNENGSVDDILRIVGDVSFPSQVIDAVSGVSHKSNNLEKPKLETFSNVRVANPPSLPDQVGAVFNGASSAINQLGTVIAALATMVGSLAIFAGWLVKRQKSNRKKKRQNRQQDTHQDS